MTPSLWRRLAACLSAGATAAVAMLAGVPVSAAAVTCTGNAIVCENQLPGTPASQWDPGAGDQSIVGFTDNISYNQGETVHLKVNTPASSVTFVVYRLGNYRGAGARQVANLTPSVALPQTQPPCLTDSTTQLLDCGNWADSATWSIPTTAVSGVYIINLSRNDTGGASLVPFVVRNDASHSALYFKTSDSTWQAYNQFGGTGLYDNTQGVRAYKVSYNRPFITRLCCGRDFVFAQEYPMIRFLEGNGYDVSYFSSVDADRYGSLLTQHKVLLSLGHDEYWSANMRNNFQAARDAGVGLAFFSGNSMYWKTRYEPSIDGTNTANRTLVTYKETWANAPIDPQEPSTWTGTWRDPRFSPPADGGRPENALQGTLYTVNRGTGPIQVPAAYSGLRFWRNTPNVSHLLPGQTWSLAPNTLGYEWDVDPDNGFRPAGLFDMSSTTMNITTNDLLVDFGNTLVTGTATHNLTLYRAASGALVFGAGTIQWAWGLDSTHDGAPSPADPDLQQATLNLFADMGAQPATPYPGLVVPAQSTDLTPPTSAITSPAPGSAVANGTPVTVTGTASDTGGGVVASVEVSTDGGATWHRAAGTTSWAYTWNVKSSGPVTVRSRAVDDSGNIESPSGGVTLLAACPCSLFGSGEAPALPAAAEAVPVEVGVKFTTDTDAGSVTGLKFYKGSGNGGTHTGHLWTAGGQLLASVTFSGESLTGWQTATFSSPVLLHANTTYVVSYLAPLGHYAADANVFWYRGIDSGNLHLARNNDAGGNGVFAYGSNGGFPINSFNASNYWVDVIWTPGLDALAPIVSSSIPAAGATNLAQTTTPAAVFNEPINQSTLAFSLADGYGHPIAGTVSYDAASRTARLIPSSPLATGSSFTASISAQDLAGNAMAPAYTWSFATGGPATCPCAIWFNSSTPRDVDSGDGHAVEVGVKFRASASGFVTGIRFYKAAANTGIHIGSLWSSAGALLGQAVFQNESASGWQNVSFPGGIPVLANTTYVASYYAPSGHYSFTSASFAGAGVTNGPLTALADGTDGPDGLYAYSAGTTFPTNTYNATNYWVDLIFNPAGAADTTPPAVVRSSPAGGAINVPTSLGSVTATFSKEVQPATIALALTDVAGRAVPTAITSYDVTTLTATFSVGAVLSLITTYTASLTARDVPGNQMRSPATWAFSTAGASCPCSIWSPAARPATADGGDGQGVEVGLKFKSDIGGSATGVRFFKSAANTGTHVGNLWSAGGQLLATVTFTGESASGWQQAAFSTPVAITAGTVYLVSYYAPAGHYSYTGAAFAGSSVDAPPLHALANSVSPNGVYRYSGSSAFPVNSYGATNYWVDVVMSQ